MQEFIRRLAELLGGPIMVWGAAAVGTFLSVKSGFVQLRFFRRSMKTVFGGIFSKRKKNGVSPFQAVTAALAGTLGTGNIAGVAVAVFVGGPGAVFGCGSALFSVWPRNMRKLRLLYGTA